MIINGYKLYYRPTGQGNYTVRSIKDPAAVSEVVAGLTNGKEYEFHLIGVNSKGDGSASNTVRATPLGPIAAPAPTAHPLAAGMQLTWLAPSAGGGTITGYWVQYREVGQSGWRAWSFSGTGNSTTTVVRRVSAEKGAKVSVVRTCGVGGAPTRRLCDFDYTRRTHRVRVQPRRTAAITVSVRISAQAPGLDRTTWRRSWQVRSQPRVACASPGNG